MRGIPVDLSGRVFGNLTVLAQSYRVRNGHKMWLCECTCGGRALKRQDRLLCGMVKSCGFGHRYGGPRGFVKKRMAK